MVHTTRNVKYFFSYITEGFKFSSIAGTLLTILVRWNPAKIIAYSHCFIAIFE